MVPERSSVREAGVLRGPRFPFEEGAQLPKIKGLGVVISLAAAIGWGVACGGLRTPFLAVTGGGLVAAALAFWLERAVLVGPETQSRNDFYLILAAACAFFAVVGVGVASVGFIVGNGLLHGPR